MACANDACLFRARQLLPERAQDPDMAAEEMFSLVRRGDGRHLTLCSGVVKQGSIPTREMLVATYSACLMSADLASACLLSSTEVFDFAAD